MIAAVEQFLRDTLPPAAPPEPAPDPWLRAARLEAVGLRRTRPSRGSPRPRPRRGARRRLARGRRSSTCATRSPPTTPGEWTMPAKVYLDAPPHGDFRAMPALGGGFAMLKWISSFPGNPAAHGLPTVMGVVCLSDARDERAADAARRARGHRAAHRRGRRGRRAGARRARAPRTRRRDRLRAARRVGGALPRRRRLRPGRVRRPAPRGRRARSRRELGWRAGERAEALACDVVCCVTPGHEPVVEVGDLRPGLHLNMLGADGPGKAEASVEAVARCALFCDEWAQASHGGELTGAVEAGAIAPRRRHRPRRGAGRRRARPPGRATRSRCSTPPAWRSRTSRSPSRRTRPGRRAPSTRRRSRSEPARRSGGRAGAVWQDGAHAPPPVRGRAARPARTRPRLLRRSHRHVHARPRPSCPAPGTGFVPLAAGRGEPYVVRRGGSAKAGDKRARKRRSLAFFAQLTDPQIADEMSPARVDFVDPAGGALKSAHRPQEALGPQTFDAIVRNVNANRRSAVEGRQGPARAAWASRSPPATSPTTSSSTRRAGSGRCSTAGASTRSRASRSARPTRARVAPPDVLARLDADVAARRYTGVQDYDDWRGARDDLYGGYWDPDEAAAAGGPYAAFPRYPGLMDRAQAPFDAAGPRRAVVRLARQPRRARAGQRRGEHGPVPRDRGRLPEGLPDAGGRPRAVRGRGRERAVPALQRPGVHRLAARRAAAPCRPTRTAGSCPSRSTAR